MVKTSWRHFFDSEFLARLERLHLAAKHESSRFRVGTRPGALVGDGLEFSDHRSYVEGDDPRFIDWACYARMERLLLRLFHRHSEADVGILLDASGSMAGGDEGKFHYARRAAAALAYVAMGGNERVTLATVADGLGSVLRTGRDRARVVEVLDFLAGVTPGGKTDLRKAFGDLLAGGGGLSAAILISDLLDCQGDLPWVLDRLRVSGIDLAVVHVFSPADAEGNLAGAVFLEQAETGATAAMEVTGPVLASYRKAWGGFQETCRRQCAAAGALYVPAPSHLPLEGLMLKSLRQVGLLKGM